MTENLKITVSFVINKYDKTLSIYSKIIIFKNKI